MIPSPTPDQSPSSAQLRQALVALKQLRARLDQAEHARTEPIAIIGMGCRFPGAPSPQAFWQLLRDGVDAVGDTPADRWDATRLYDPDPAAPGKLSTRWGGFLTSVDTFDAAFFGISPREAAQMDPQQRLLLEVAYEALESGGQTLEALAGSQTGVFIGVHSHSSDYFLLQVEGDQLDTYSGTGTSHSVLAGRLSYLLDLQGPSMALDTACSSSLVAVHLACQSLRSGESRLALAGGVNLILEPSFTETASRMHMLSADGRCKAFDSRADGFVRGEGCGVVVLKRLTDALADGDTVLAVIHGSAVNQDGHTNGLTAPNSLSQQRAIRQALQNAGVEPGDISYVETHGTGTALGDPIEIEALSAVLGSRAEPGDTCLLGSAKTNIGHLEGAAGVAGLIKVVLSMQHAEIPPLLHFRELNPHISLANTPFVIPTTLQTWPAGERRRYAGLSAFGWSGTNAHVVVGEAPASPSPLASEASRPVEPRLLVLSARGASPLEALAASYHEFLVAPGAGSRLALANICDTAATRRSHLEHRLAVVGKSHAEIAEGLQRHLSGTSVSSSSTGVAGSGRRPGIVFVCPGQGSQWLGMARDLLATVPVFKAALERCETAFSRYVDWSLLAELGAPAATSRLDQIDVVQPMLCAIQIGLAAVWRSWGIEPDAVVGHSMGEVAAAYIAGCLTLEDAARIICVRSQVLLRVSGQGAMAVVELTLEEASAELVGYEDRVTVAVSNSPRSTVLSGDPTTLETILVRLKQRGVFCRTVKVDVASHSPQMDPLRADLLRLLDGLTPVSGSVPFYSTVLGQTVDGARLDPSYWVQNLRQPVLFAQSVQRLIADGNPLFVELSPHPVLLPSIDEGLQQAHASGLAVASLRRDQSDLTQLLAGLGALFVRGCEVDWSHVFDTSSRTPVPLPGYPWQRERFWLDAPSTSGRPVESLPPPGNTATPEAYAWELDFSRLTRPELYEHRIHGVAVLPASAYAELVLTAASEAFGQVGAVRNLTFFQAIYLDEDEPRRIRIGLTTESSGEHVLRVSAQSDVGWTLHASCTIETGEDLNSGSFVTLVGVDAESNYGRTAAGADVYRRLAADGAQIGSVLQHIEQAWFTDDEALARIDSSHAALPLDAGFQLGAAVLAGAAAADSEAALYLPTSIDEVRLVGPWRELGKAHVRTRPAQSDTTLAVQDVELLGEDGSAVVIMRGLRLQRPTASAPSIEQSLYRLTWHATDQPVAKAPLTPGSWLVLADRQGIGQALAERLRALGERCVVGHADSSPLLKLMDEAGVAGQPIWRGIVHLWGINAPEPDSISADELEAAEASPCTSALAVLQAVGRFPAAESARLWLVTQGAQSVVSTDDPSPVQAALWGLGRVMAAEQPDHWGGLYDLEPGISTADAAERLLTELFPAQTDNEVALRAGQRYVARLAPAGRAAVGDQTTPITFRADASYLITGGLGGVGLAVAHWMIERGARRLILMGRTALPDRASWADLDPESASGSRVAAVRALEALGASIHLASVDVAEQAQLETFVQRFQREGWPPIRGIVHAAGVTADRLLDQLEAADLERVLRPKLLGGWALHHLFGDRLDFFVLFSSLGALLGQPGQGAYAAANSALDALAQHRRTHHLPAVSINWGVWANLGFAATAGGQRTVDQLEREGIARFGALENLAVLEHVLKNPSTEPPQVIVLPLDRARLPRSTGGVARSRLLVDLVDASPASTDQAAPQPTGLRATLLALPADQRRATLESELQREIGEVMQLAPARVDRGKPLGTLGMDSIMSLELRNRLERRLGISLSATLVWNYPTIVDMAPYLATKLGVTLDADNQPRTPHQPVASATNEAPGTDVRHLSEDEALRKLLGDAAD